ncbi:MAG TPA: sulfatase-like hydrolase/transferase [Planctomycetaceae bacterium]|nr:sulfatase-like hydrolase/transferase [Planctomycetaceae bacterium]
MQADSSVAPSNAVLCGIVVLLLAPLAGRADVAAARAPQPNVLLIVSDDQRPDTIAALGNAAIRTPHLDRLVANGIVFTRAICANPICTPSRAEILTGATGFRNGVFDFGRPISPDAPRWPETMRGAGYQTWYVGKWHNNGRPHDHGYEQTDGLFAGGGGQWWVPTTDWNGRDVTGYRGWVFHTDDGRVQPEKGVGLTPDISARFADAAIRIIRRGRESRRPYFLHVNFTAPHDPLLMPFGHEQLYDPGALPLPGNLLPEHPFDHGNFRGRDELLFEWPRTPEMVRDELAVYYAVITHMDAQIGRILAALDETGQRENTLVIFTSDHGLAVGSHGLRGKQSMYEHTIGVPLVMSGPGISRGARSDAQCCLRDLFPTVCELCGIPVPVAVEGRSLRPVLAGEAESVHPFVVGYFRNFQRMIRTDEWKLIWYPHLNRYQLFNLDSDPDELRDRVGEADSAGVVADLRGKLEAWLRKHGDPLLDAPAAE